MQRLDNSHQMERAAAAFDDNRGENDAAAAITVGEMGHGWARSGAAEQRLNATGDFDERPRGSELVREQRL